MDHCIARGFDEGYARTCDGACKKGPGNHCIYWFTDPLWHMMLNWAREANVAKIMYRIDYTNNELIIGTTKPGYMIGSQGGLIYKYMEEIRPLVDGRIAKKDHFIRFVEFSDVVEID